MKTPEEMAEEYIRYENESAYWTKHAFLAGYKAAQQWISVKDRLPEETLENAIVLVWRASWHDYDTVKWKSCGFDDVNPETITHWQPLPAPPKEEK